MHCFFYPNTIHFINQVEKFSNGLFDHGIKLVYENMWNLKNTKLNSDNLPDKLRRLFEYKIQEHEIFREYKVRERFFSFVAKPTDHYLYIY